VVNRRQPFSGEQPDLFQHLSETVPTVALDLDLGDELRGAISGAIRRARQRGMGRDRIVDQMNRRLPELPRPVTLRQLDAWTAASKEFHEFPLRYIAAFCAAVDDLSPLLLVLGALGLEAVDARDAKALRLGELAVRQAALSREARLLKTELGA
jgi:hypothetical protein